jgi:GNAT superfamily N-acetyltransferase
VSDSLIIRPGTAADSWAALTVFRHAITNFSRQWGLIAPSAPWPDQADLTASWGRIGSLYEFLAVHGDQFWLAEQHGQVVGYARSIFSDGVRELTEFFVHPQAQAAGIGRQLLAKAFPLDGARHRVVIATLEPSAQSLYMQSKVYPRFPLRNFGRKPEITTVETDLEFVPVTDTPDTLDIIAAIDDAVLGYRRDEIHQWLLQTRQGFVCYRQQQAVGFGYVGQHSGPFAALEATDFPAILAYAETNAVEQALENFAVVAPLINPTVMNYLHSRRYQMGRFVAEVMMDEPFGHFDHYVATAPMFFL